MAWAQGDELIPALAGLGRGLDHQAVLSGHGADQGVELVGGESAALAGDDLGSSMCSHGLTTMRWSGTARLKVECSMVVYFVIDLGDRPVALAWVTQSWTSDGVILAMARRPKNEQKVLVPSWEQDLHGRRRCAESHS